MEPLTESRDSRSFSTKFSGGRIPRAGLLMNVLCKKPRMSAVISCLTQVLPTGDGFQCFTLPGMTVSCTFREIH